MPPETSTTADAVRRTSPMVAAAQIAREAVAIGVLATLWRLLGLKPFGLLGMVMPLFWLMRLFYTGGLDVATIQHPRLDPRRLSALFWLGQILGLAMAAVTAACAPLLAWFYGVEELAPLTRAMAAIPLAHALCAQHLAMLQHRLRLGTVAGLRLVAMAAAGAGAVAAASGGWGVWALVVQQYVEPLVLAAGAWLCQPWRPTLVLRGTGAGPLVRFGGFFTASNLMFYLTTNLDKVLVGYLLGKEALGLYSQAFSLMMRPVHSIVSPLTGMMMPALARAAGGAEYRRLLRAFFRFIALVMLPAGAGMFLVAPEAVRVLGGDEWAPAGMVLVALAPALLAQGFFNALGSVFVSAGRADRLFHCSAVIAAVFAAAFAIGIQCGQTDQERLVALALGYTVALVLVVMPPYLVIALRTAGVAGRPILAAVLPAARAALGMAAVVGAARAVLTILVPLPDLPLLAIEVLLGVSSYALLARRELAWLARMRRRQTRTSEVLETSEV